MNKTAGAEDDQYRQSEGGKKHRARSLQDGRGKPKYNAAVALNASRITTSNATPLLSVATKLSCPTLVNILAPREGVASLKISAKQTTK